MCIYAANPVNIESVIAYKTMHPDPRNKYDSWIGDLLFPNLMKKWNNRVVSLNAENSYFLGRVYLAGYPKRELVESEHYTKGFHAYREEIDAWREQGAFFRAFVVRVKLLDVIYVGMDSAGYNSTATTYVANRCEFLEILRSPTYANN